MILTGTAAYTLLGVNQEGTVAILGAPSGGAFAINFALWESHLGNLQKPIYTERDAVVFPFVRQDRALSGLIHPLDFYSPTVEDFADPVFLAKYDDYMANHSPFGQARVEVTRWTDPKSGFSLDCGFAPENGGQWVVKIREAA